MTFFQQLEVLQLNLQNKSNVILNILNDGLEEKVVEELFNKAAMYAVPRAIKQIYQWHNGTKGGRNKFVFPRLHFYDLENAIKLKAEVDSYAHATASEISSEDTELYFHWSDAMLPIMQQSDGGTYLVVDCSCDNNKLSSNPVLYYWIGDSDIGNRNLYKFGIPVIYDSIESMIKTINDCFNNNVYSIVDGIIVSDTNVEIKISQLNNPNSEFWKLAAIQ